MGLAVRYIAQIAGAKEMNGARLFTLAFNDWRDGAFALGGALLAIVIAVLITEWRR